MNNKVIVLPALGAVLALGATTAFAYPGAQLAPQARVTMAQARATALRTVHGTIAAAELEKESGGSGLRYSFDVKTAHGVREVGIDAKTGAVLENSSEAQAKPSGKSDESDGD